MKCNQSSQGFELVSSCSYSATISITPRAPPFFRIINTTDEALLNVMSKILYTALKKVTQVEAGHFLMIAATSTFSRKCCPRSRSFTGPFHASKVFFIDWQLRLTKLITMPLLKLRSTMLSSFQTNRGNKKKQKTKKQTWKWIGELTFTNSPLMSTSQCSFVVVVTAVCVLFSTSPPLTHIFDDVTWLMLPVIACLSQSLNHATNENENENWE